MKRAKGQQAFTLIELMVSVALMLILVGAVVMVFSSSSEVFIAAEAKMTIHQNARVAMEFMARELASATADIVDPTFTNPANGFGTPPPTASDPTNRPNANRMWINTPTLATDPQRIMFFTTTTSHPTTGTPPPNYETGVAIVAYNLKKTITVGPQPLWKLYRCVHYYHATSHQLDEERVLAQYIPQDAGGIPRIRIEALQFSGGGSATSSGDYTTNLPAAVRITMDICDQHCRHIRTFSRVIWIPSTTN